MPTPTLSASDEARFWSRVTKGDGCWVFQFRSSNTGYGQFQIARRPWLAHRVSFALANGPLPEGPMVLHRCGTKACVRPDHLYLGTPADNRADEMLKVPDPRRGWICLTEAARELGVTRDTLRQQLARKKLHGRKFMEWYLEPSEVERYRRESLGKRGRPHAASS